MLTSPWVLHPKSPIIVRPFRNVVSSRLHRSSCFVVVRPIRASMGVLAASPLYRMANHTASSRTAVRSTVCRYTRGCAFVRVSAVRASVVGVRVSRGRANDRFVLRDAGSHIRC